MWIKVTVTGPNGKMTEQACDVQEDKQLEATISAAINDYRRLYPDALPFEFAVKVSPA